MWLDFVTQQLLIKYLETFCSIMCIVWFRKKKTTSPTEGDWNFLEMGGWGESVRPQNYV